MKFLITRTDVYRCDDEKEAENFVKELRAHENVIASSLQHKEKKAKGEVIDEWTRLTVKLAYNDEKEPCDPIEEGNNEEF